MTENEVAKQIVDVLGLLINFNVDLIKNGISRVVNGLSE